MKLLKFIAWSAHWSALRVLIKQHEREIAMKKQYIEGSFEELEELLEQIIDRHGMVNFFQVLDNIIIGKSQHIRENWQDEQLARSWERVSNKLYTVTRLVEEEGI